MLEKIGIVSEAFEQMIQYNNVLGKAVDKKVLVIDFVGGENDSGTIKRK
jgi:hypothetical protein